MVPLYSSFTTQFYAWAHYLVAFSLIYVVVPRFFFVKVSGSVMDRLIANYVRMVFFVISAAYVLVVMKLYEVIGLVCAGLVFMAWKQLRGRTNPPSSGISLVAMALDVIEFPSDVLKSARQYREIGRRVFHRFRRPKFRVSLKAIRIVMTVLVLGTSVIIRLYDAVLVAAPEQSDGDVTLAWLKYINERVLFHDGIYPQGMYMYLATLGKFAVLDPLFIMKFSGPLATCLIVALIYHFIRGFTHSDVGGIVGALVYGLLGYHFLGDDWTRQAATNSQEFGFIFTFPVIYFLRRYLEGGRRFDFWVAFASLCDAGLVHAVSYELAALGGIAVVLAAAAINFRALKVRLAASLLGGVGSGFVSLIPLCLGLALRIHVNASAGTYLVSSGSASRPVLNVFDDLAISSICFLLCIAVLNRVKRQHPWSTMTVATWGLMCLLIYDFGGEVTHSTVLASRMQDLWAITAAVNIGMAAHVLYTLLGRFRFRSFAEGLGWMGCVGSVAIFAPPRLVVPYTVQWNDDINAYLKINHAFRYTAGGYLIVAQNFEYALVFGGNGFRMDPHQFLTTYNPTKPALIRYGSLTIDPSISPYVFLYYNKHIFEVSESNSIYSIERPLYRAESENRTLMSQWLREFRDSNGPGAVKVFYNGPDVEVFKIKTK